MSPSAAPADRFGVAELRRRALAAWQESPARFRADANLEDDLAVVGYRDRVVVELAQNAADAATRGGVPGRLVLELDGGVLTAANTGAPLDAQGVESIAVARASSKHGESDLVGRFGVGFAAVLAVSDEPSIVSRSGAVRWSRAEALTAVSGIAGLSEELARRDGHVPVLRLPFAADGTPPDGLDTVVVAPLRDPATAAAVRDQLAAIDPTLLLALPALTTVEVRGAGESRVLRRERLGDVVVVHDEAGGTAAVTRWLVCEDSGVLPADLLVGQPAEAGDEWRVAWAMPVDDEGRIVAVPTGVPALVRAPTPVDEPLTMPAVLIASYPLDATRRRVTEGAVAEAVTAHAARVLLAAVLSLAPDPSVLRLVPAGLPDGWLDASLHGAILDQLRTTAWLPVGADDEVRQRPGDAILVADALAPVLGDALPGVLPPGWGSSSLTALGVHRPTIAEIVEAVADVHREPSWWQALYAALAEAVPAGSDRDALGALPVPLTDGTTVRGPRLVALPTEATPSADLAVLGIRLVHPEAAHPLLRALGAADAEPGALLTQPRVQAAVEASYDDDDPTPIAEAVLALVAASGMDSGELPWLAELALPDDAGDWRPAGELLLPGGRMAGLVASDSAFGVVAADWLDRWGAAALAAVGVADQPAILRTADALGPEHNLDDEPAWWSQLPEGATVPDFVAVRDLEQVRDDATAALLETLADPELRGAVVEPTLVVLPDGGSVRVRSYTAWWLGVHARIDGRLVTDLRLPGADPVLDGLFDIAPDLADDAMLRAVGVLGSLDDANADDVLARLADPDRPITHRQLLRLDAWLATRHAMPPDRVRALRGDTVVVVDAADAVIIDAPDLAQLLADRARVPVPFSMAVDLAAVLDVALASELADYPVVSEGRPVGDAVIHDVLLVGGAFGAPTAVAWRFVDGVLHVADDQRALGLGRGRAWRDRSWADRHRRTEALLELLPDRLRAAEDDGDDLIGYDDLTEDRE